MHVVARDGSGKFGSCFFVWASKNRVCAAGEVVATGHLPSPPEQVKKANATSWPHTTCPARGSWQLLSSAFLGCASLRCSDTVRCASPAGSVFLRYCPATAQPQPEHHLLQPLLSAGLRCSLPPLTLLPSLTGPHETGGGYPIEQPTGCCSSSMYCSPVHATESGR